MADMKILTPLQVSGSTSENTLSLKVFGSASVSGDLAVSKNLTVDGDFVVKGTTTAIDTVNLKVQDPLIFLGTASYGDAVPDGDRGIIFNLTGSDKKAFFWDDSDSKFRLATTTTDATGSELVVGTSLALEVGELKVGGQLQLTSSTTSSFWSVVTGDSWIDGVTGSVLNLTSALKQLDEAVYGSISATEYYSVRAAVTHSVQTAGTPLVFQFSGTAESPTTVGSTLTSKAIVGLTASTSEGILDAISYASFDVAIKASGSSVWTNDLVSLQLDVSASNDNNYWFPMFTIDAPAAAETSVIRLIVVNEKANILS